MTFDLHIMGGTLASTFAGEYSFMIALALSLFFLGTLARARSTAAVPLWLPAVLLASTVTSHLVVAIFAVFAGVVIWLIYHPVRNLTRASPPSARWAMLLTAFWLLPLAVNLGNTTDMRYEPIGNYLDWMFLSENWFLYPLAVVALGAGIYYRRRATLDPRRDHPDDRSRLLQLGGPARRARQGAGVEPAAAPVLVPDAVPARRRGRGGDGAPHRRSVPRG